MLEFLFSNFSRHYFYVQSCNWFAGQVLTIFNWRKMKLRFSLKHFGFELAIPKVLSKSFLSIFLFIFVQNIFHLENFIRIQLNWCNRRTFWLYLSLSSISSHSKELSKQPFERSQAKRERPGEQQHLFALDSPAPDWCIPQLLRHKKTWKYISHFSLNQC